MPFPFAITDHVATLSVAAVISGGGGGDNTSPWAVVMLIASPVLPVLVFIMFQSIMINQRDSE